MKYNLIILCIQSLLPLSSAQKDLEFYTLEEAIVLIAEESSYGPVPK